MRQLLAAAILSTASLSAIAANQGAYLTADYGRVSYSLGFSSPSAIRIGGGYHFSPNLGVEAGYSIIGKTTDNFSSGGANSTETLKASVLQVAAVGTYPINNKFELFAKLGLANTKLDYTYSAVFANPSTGTGSGTKTNLLVGIGAQFNINKDFGIRASYEDFGKTKLNIAWNDGTSASVDGPSIKVTSIGVVYNF